MPKRHFTDKELDAIGLRYYSTPGHSAAFILPRFASNALRIEGSSVGNGTVK